ncbi:MAG: ABC transporter ATP-binding protein [Eubacteriales bacterium]
MSNCIISMEDIVKNFFIGTPNELHILKNINLEIKRGEFVSIVGASGSGKSTLMNLIGALDRATSGSYVLDGISIDEMNDVELSDIRNKKIGFVFQTFNLIPRNSALKNVELPMLYAGMERGKRIARAKELLELVGIGDRINHMPNELSGGQKQRVAIARALANDPAIILADEPTGALDSETGHHVIDLFHKIQKEEGKTIVLITHNHELAAETQRTITIKDGEIIGLTRHRHKKDVIVEGEDTSCS